MNRLLLAIENYQASKRYCDRMIFLKKRVGSTATNSLDTFVESKTVQSEAVLKLSQTLHAFRGDFFSRPDPQSPKDTQCVWSGLAAVAGAGAGGSFTVTLMNPFLGGVATAATTNSRGFSEVSICFIISISYDS